MKKLINGIVEFRQNQQKDYLDRYKDLTQGQKPQVLLITCSDSRLVPTTMTNCEPGDLFMHRNVGNMVPVSGDGSLSEGAAIEFALENLQVKDIIVCGHSKCGAMEAILAGPEKIASPHLKNWLQQGAGLKEKMSATSEPNSTASFGPDSELSEADRLSQLNVLAQLENLKTYPAVQEGLAKGHLKLHAWWYAMGWADVYTYNDEHKKFVLIEA